MNKPNVLLIITDHVAWHQHQASTGFKLKLPAWEKFISEGINFSNAYTVSPICTPARASILTGQYPSKHGLKWNTEASRLNGLSDFGKGQKLFTCHLGANGYRNAYVGKWHCGSKKTALDFNMEGWSVADYGQPYKTEKYRQYIEQKGLSMPHGEIEYRLRSHETGYRAISEYMDASGVMSGPKEGHHDHFISNLSIEKMNELKNSEKPWSLSASFWGPHHAYFPTSEFTGKVDPQSIPLYPSFNDKLESKPFRYKQHLNSHKGRNSWPTWSTWQKVLQRAYEQQIQTDDAVEKLLQALEDSGQKENTVVIWVADHGDGIGAHGGTWDKASVFTEEITRIPMAIRWPKKIEPQTCEELVCNMDVAPSVLAAANITVPSGMDGLNLLELSINTEGKWPAERVFEHHGHGLELVQRIIVDGRWKYCSALFDGDELYDLKNDPFELKNLISSSEHFDLCCKLRGKLLSHINNTHDHAAVSLKFWLENQGL